MIMCKRKEINCLFYPEDIVQNKEDLTAGKIFLDEYTSLSDDYIVNLMLSIDSFNESFLKFLDVICVETNDAKKTKDLSVKHSTGDILHVRYKTVKSLKSANYLVLTLEMLVKEENKEII